MSPAKRRPPVPRRRGRARASVVVAAIAAIGLAARAPARAGDGPASPPDVVVVAQDDLTGVERDAGTAGLASLVWLAAAPASSAPPEGAADATAFAVGDGLALTTAHYLERVAAMPGGAKLWARSPTSAWTPAAIVARCAWADVGVVRLVGGPVRTALKLGAAPRAPTGRLVVAGPGLRPFTAELRAANVASIAFFDPGVEGGRAEARRGGPDRRPATGGLTLAIRLAETIAGRAIEGAPLFDAEGACAGMVVSVDPDRPGTESVLARAPDVLRTVLTRVETDGRSDPVDLGVRLELPGAPIGGPVGPAPLRVPSTLERLRGTTKEKGGALVVDVRRGSPAFGVLWPGELVLELGGRPLFAEVPESVHLALLALREGMPVEVTVWRGRREKVALLVK